MHHRLRLKLILTIVFKVDDKFPLIPTIQKKLNHFLPVSKEKPRSDSHCKESCHHGAKVVVEETRWQRGEAVHEGGDGEN